MRGQRWVIGAVLAIAVANTGCVTCCHKGYEKSLEHATECDLPGSCRNQTYAFLINGVTPPTHDGLNALRMKLAENGFAKVGIADLAGGLCVEHEVKKIVACEPDAKFVLIGYDVGASVAVCAARDLSANGVAVEAVVLLDPVACKDACGVPTLLITSGKHANTATHSQHVPVPEVGHFGLPAHPTTVAVITDLLRGIAATCPGPNTDPVPQWSYKHAPAMRPEAKARANEEWNFLADRGPTRQMGTVVAAQPVPAAPPNSAGAVLLRK
jgi:hypothetical protein